MSRDAESDFFEEFVAKAKADAMAPGFTGSFFSYGPGGVVQASGNVHVSLAGPVVIEGIARFDELSISGNCLFKTGSSLLMNNGKKITFTEDCEIKELKFYSDGHLKIVTPSGPDFYEVLTDWNYPPEAEAHKMTDDAWELAGMSIDYD